MKQYVVRLVLADDKFCVVGLLPVVVDYCPIWEWAAKRLFGYQYMFSDISVFTASLVIGAHKFITVSIYRYPPLPSGVIFA